MSAQLEHYYRKKTELIALLGGVCVVCGTTVDLQFHHKDPSQKKFTIASRYGLKMDKLQDELGKCELRCSLHHKEMHAATHGTLGYYRHQRCRCDICVTAYNAYMKNYMRKRRKRGG
jgi:hypothetical protein